VPEAEPSGSRKTENGIAREAISQRERVTVDPRYEGTCCGGLRRAGGLCGGHDQDDSSESMRLLYPWSAYRGRRQDILCRGWLIQSSFYMSGAVYDASRPGFTEAEAQTALGFSEARATQCLRRPPLSAT